MFIQIIRGMCVDEETMRRQMDVWRESIESQAQGWLGGTYGLTDDGEFVGVVRFDSREAAASNSLRPEQDAWWRATSACFDGEVTFHDCEDAMVFLDGGSDDAGFVQLMQGRLTDPERFRTFMSQPMDILHAARPEIIGGTIAIAADGWFTQTISFRSEAEAREGERKEMSAEAAAEMAEEMAVMQDLTYKDLHHPWSASAARSV